MSIIQCAYYTNTTKQWDPLTEAVVAAEDKPRVDDTQHLDDNHVETAPSTPKDPFPSVSAVPFRSNVKGQEQLPPSPRKQTRAYKPYAADFQMLRAEFEKWVQQKLTNFYKL